MSVCDLNPHHDKRLIPVFQLARACHYEAAHSQQVTRLALQLFDQLGELHQLGTEDRFLLTAAGLLHDIGWVEGKKAHHKVALRLITTSTLLPWDPRMRRIVGSIARYHRKALPKLSHKHFAALAEEDRQRVARLAALLRVADGMDRSHRHVVQAVRCTFTGKVVELAVTAGTAPAGEPEYAVRKGDLFEQVYGRPLVWLWTGPADASGMR